MRVLDLHLKRPLTQRLIVALTTAGLIFAPMASSTWQRALQHSLAPSLYLVNHSGWHLNYALTEIIIAFAVALALVCTQCASLHYVTCICTTLPRHLSRRKQEIYPMSVNQKIVTDLINNKIEFVTTVPCKQLAGVIDEIDSAKSIYHIPVSYTHLTLPTKA